MAMWGHPSGLAKTGLSVRPIRVNCHAVAATTSGEYSESNPGRDALIGDGLVPLRSALGQHDEARHVLAFETHNQWTA